MTTFYLKTSPGESASLQTASKKDPGNVINVGNGKLPLLCVQRRRRRAQGDK